MELVVGATYASLTIRTSHAGDIVIKKVTVVDEITDPDGVDTYILHTPVGQCPKSWVIEAELNDPDA